MSFVLVSSLILRGRPIGSWILLFVGSDCHICWALGSPGASVCCSDLVLRGCFSVLLRCCRLPSASQLGRLGALGHGADIGQTQLRLSLLSHESRAAACPSPSGAARQYKPSSVLHSELPPVFPSTRDYYTERHYPPATDDTTQSL